MIFIQLVGLSGSGKSTLAFLIQKELTQKGYKTEVIDGDEYRKVICKDLGFSKEDRIENIRRLSFIAGLLVKNEIVTILSAINPYESVRIETKEKYNNVYTVWLDCPIELLIKNDPKGLYRKALLPAGHPDNINNFTGISDVFETPHELDLVIKTHIENVEASKEKLLNFIILKLQNLD